MDDQSLGQTPSPGANQTPEPMPIPVMEPAAPAPAPAMVMDETPTPVVAQSSPTKKCNCMWCAGGGAVTGAVIVAVAGGLWYFYSLGTPPPVPEAPIAETPAPVVDPAQIPPITAGNTTADISADLNQLPDMTAALDADAAAASDVISGL